MAKKQPVRKSFAEVVFRGKPKVVRAFLEGLIMGSGLRATVYYSFLDGIAHDGKAAQMAEMVGIRASNCHVVVDGETSRLLKRLAKRIVAETGLEITSHRRVRSASMEFSYEAFAPRYHEEIKQVLDHLPAGLHRRGFEENVEQDPDATGVEAYAPAHDFEARGRGTISGPVDVLVAFRKRCREYPLIRTEDIVLRTG